MNILVVIEVILLIVCSWFTIAMTVGAIRKIHRALYMLSLVGAIYTIYFIFSILGWRDIGDIIRLIAFVLFLLYIIFFGNVLEREKIYMKHLMLFKSVRARTGE